MYFYFSQRSEVFKTAFPSTHPLLWFITKKKLIIFLHNRDNIFVKRSIVYPQCASLTWGLTLQYEIAIIIPRCYWYSVRKAVPLKGVLDTKKKQKRLARCSFQYCSCILSTSTFIHFFSTLNPHFLLSWNMGSSKPVLCQILKTC